MITIDGLPAHPLIVHVVVVLLPLAAVGTLLVLARPVWRRTLGVPVLVLALLGTLAIPAATTTGDQLKGAIGGGGPLVAIHEQRADGLLPYAVAFTVLLAAALLVGRLADRAAGPGMTSARTTQTRLTVGLAVVAAVLGIVVTVLVVRIGDAGATAVWQGINTHPPSH